MDAPIEETPVPKVVWSGCIYCQQTAEKCPECGEPVCEDDLDRHQQDCGVKEDDDDDDYAPEY